MRDGVEVADEGVLEMRCPAVMNGYHKLPDVTRKAMTQDGYYITGDVFRRDADGFFYFVGRADDMFVCGGENIYPGRGGEDAGAASCRAPGLRRAGAG